MQEDKAVLNATLEAWEKNNQVLINLLNAVPPGGLEAKTTDSSKSVSQMFMHIHHERMVSVSEEAPEIKVQVPEIEWAHESDSNKIAGLLKDSGKAVRDAVVSRVEAEKNLELSFNHPIQLINFLTFHEGYHHGQIKTALKVWGIPITDDVAGPLTWDIWRSRK